VTAGSATAMSLTVDPTTNQATTSGFHYDLNGNATNLPNLTSTLTYDIENRTGSSNTTYPGLYYDLENQPLDRTGGGQWNLYGLHGERLATYTYSPGNQLDHPNPCAGYCYYLRHGYPTQTSRNIYFGGRLIQSNNKTVVLDRLGSVRANEAGETFEYFPYGEEIGTTANDREKFATYTRESSTGLDYADQRYYSSVYGTFTSSDPLHSSATSPANPMNPGSWNRYNYTGGDPVNRNDPTGTDWIYQLDGGWCSTDPSGDCYGPEVYDIGCLENPVACAISYGSNNPPGPGNGGVPDNQHVTPPTCEIELWSRPARINGHGNRGGHTYIFALDTAAPSPVIIEAGFDHDSGPEHGTLEGFVNPPGGPVLGIGTTHASDPTNLYNLNNNYEIGTPFTGPMACADVGIIESLELSYNAGPRVPYYLLGQYNSNSFTFTLLSDVGLSSNFGSLPTHFNPFHPGRFFYPGWNELVPGLHP
jgi:RHS repeat-associated protein